MDIKPGEFVTGRNKASLELNLTPQKYRTALKYLESTNRITIKTTNKFTVVAINNWESYQLDKSGPQQTNQQLTNQQPTTNQQLTTYKNVKNEKNANNEKKKGVDFPDYFDNPTFQTAWQEWVQYRKETRHTLTPSTIARQLKMFVKFTEAEAVAMITRSIENGWQGLFPADAKATASNKTKLYPIKGKRCGKTGCGMPAVYKSPGDFDNYYCTKHMPDKVKADFL